jgi:hypothetical protein
LKNGKFEIIFSLPAFPFLASVWVLDQKSSLSPKLGRRGQKQKEKKPKQNYRDSVAVYKKTGLRVGSDSIPHRVVCR